MKKELQKLVKKDQYNFLSPYGLGDTMMLCGFAAAWEKKHHGKIHFIIKPSHEVVMKMYGISDYSCYDFQREWNKPEFMKIAKHNPVAEKGRIYIAHPHFHRKKFSDFLQRADSCDTTVPFADFYKEFLGLPLSAKMIQPKYDFDLTESLKQKLTKFGPVESIILLLPEAQSLPLLNQQFWAEVIKQQNRKYTLIQYVLNPKNAVRGIPCVDMTIEEIIALSEKCAKVIAYRSGLCDLMAPFCKQMIVFYPGLFPNMKDRFALTGKNIQQFNVYSVFHRFYLLFFLPVIKIWERAVGFPTDQSDEGIIKKDIFLFHLFPFIRCVERGNKSKYYFLNFFPLLKVKRFHLRKIKYYLFFILPLMKLKRKLK